MVHPFRESFRRPFFSVNIAMKYLARGRNPRVGPARSGHANILPGQLGEGLFHNVLYSPATGLRLPSMERPSVVGDNKSEPSQG